MKKITIILSLLAALLLAAQEQTLIVRMVRHGQPGIQGTDFTPADKQTWIGLGLTPLGRRQAEVTGQFLKKRRDPMGKSHCIAAGTGIRNGGYHLRYSR